VKIGIEYLCNCNDSDYYFVGVVGSLLEQAFLQYPVISDGSDVYQLIDKKMKEKSQKISVYKISESSYGDDYYRTPFHLHRLGIETISCEWSCDVCHGFFQKGKIYQSYRCIPCDYDMCVQCKERHDKKIERSIDPFDSFSTSFVRSIEVDSIDEQFLFLIPVWEDPPTEENQESRQRLYQILGNCKESNEKLRNIDQPKSTVRALKACDLHHLV